MSEYSRHPKNMKLRDRIIRKTMPLIDAAISRKIKNHKNREDVRKDLRQECVVKLLYALPKFDSSRGNSFAYLWTTICNTCNTQGQRLTRSDLSMSTDEDVMREAENNGHDVFQTPENRHILNVIGASITKTFDTIDLSDKDRQLHKRACRKIKGFIINGELFYDRDLVVRKLKKIGLGRKEIQFYLDRTLVLVRQKLLSAKENALAISVRETDTPLPKNTHTRIL
jgi:hypothetical protein